MAGGHALGELRCGEAKARRERQIEEQFKGTCDTVRLVSIGSTHSSRDVAEGANAGLHFN